MPSSQKPAMWERPVVEKERPSIIKKEEPKPSQPEVAVQSESESSSDEDGYDQDMIEEQIDRIDNEITKQERLLAQLRAQIAEEQSTVEVTMVVSKLSNSKTGVSLGDCVLEKRVIEPNLIPPVSMEQLIDDVYAQNRQLIAQVKQKQNERGWFVFHLSNPEGTIEPSFDPTIWEQKLEIKPKTRAAVVAFLSAKYKQRNMELDRRIHEYRTLKQRYSDEFVKLEKQIQEKQEKTKVEIPRGRRGMGFGKGDVVRNEQEWNRALAMLGMQSDKDIYAKEVPMLSRSDLQREYRFCNHNDLVVDPEAELKRFNSQHEAKWSDHDIQLFRSLLSQHGKDFFKIGNDMDGFGKTTHECIWYYYKEKINARFKNLLKRRGKKRKDTPYMGKCGIRVYQLEDDEIATVAPAEDTDEEEVAVGDGNGILDTLGSWTYEQLDKLKKAVEDYKHDFKKVSQLLGKPPPICQLAYRLFKRGDVSIFGISEKEEKKAIRKKKKKKKEEDNEISRQTVESGEEGEDEGIVN
jgi:hypothetical protein